MRLRFAALILAAAFVASCRAEIANPTGSCEAPNDGFRFAYHAPGDDSTWLPDCQNPLQREYWRVFAVSAASAYTIPRLDGEPRLQPACTDAAHPMAALVSLYGLCASATNEAEVRRVNDMAPVDALALTHFLHGELRFTVPSGGVAVDPWPIPSDVLDVCSQRSGAVSSELNDNCDRIRKGFDTGYMLSETSAVELAVGLNSLYGIAPSP
jgi:hypothetical protein